MFLATVAEFGGLVYFPRDGLIQPNSATPFFCGHLRTLEPLGDPVDVL